MDKWNEHTKPYGESGKNKKPVEWSWYRGKRRERRRVLQEGDTAQVQLWGRREKEINSEKQKVLRNTQFQKNRYERTPVSLHRTFIFLILNEDKGGQKCLLPQFKFPGCEYSRWTVNWQAQVGHNWEEVEATAAKGMDTGSVWTCI